MRENIQIGGRTCDALILAVALTLLAMLAFAFYMPM